MADKAKSYDVSEARDLLREFLAQQNPELGADARRRNATGLVAAFVVVARELKLEVRVLSDRTVWVGLPDRLHQAVVQVSDEGEVSVGEPLDDPGSFPFEIVGKPEIVGPHDPGKLATVVIRIMKQRAEKIRSGRFG